MITRILLIAAALSAGLNAQSFPSHVAMDALLDIRFFPEQGQFMMATSVPVLFPPAGETKARLLIKKVGGSAVVTKNMIVEPWPPHAAFGNLKPADGQMSFGPIPAGDYVMSVEMNGKEISAYSFSLAAEQGGDPFNPKNSLVRTGPWSKGGVSDRPGRGYGAIGGSGHLAEYRELPGYAPRKQVPYTLHLINGGKQIGLVEGMVSDGDWTLFKPEVRQGHGGGPVKWKVLISNPGADTLEYRAAGKTIRTYKFQVAGGKIGRIAQNELGYAGPDGLPPQSLISDKRVEQFWLAPIR